MKYVTLGKSDLKVSVIGQGTGQFGTPAWGYGRQFSDSDIFEAVKKDIEMGVNLFDTAETYGYGRSEILLGNALRNYKRDNFHIISKVAPWNLTYDEVLKAAERSLQRLGTSFIDLYLIHYPNPFVSIKQTLRALEMLIKKGKVRFIGTSNFHPIQLKMAQESLSSTEIIANEIEYNILSRRSENYTIPYCINQKIGVITFSPLAGGILTGRYSASNLPRDRARAFNFVARRSFLKKSTKLIRILNDIAAKKHASIAQVALGWIISHPACVAIPAALNAPEAAEDAAAGTLSLSKDEINRINEASPWLSSPTYAFDHYIIRPISWTKEALKQYARM